MFLEYYDNNIIKCYMACNLNNKNCIIITFKIVNSCKSFSFEDLILEKINIGNVNFDNFNFGITGNLAKKIENFIYEKLERNLNAKV